MTITEQQYYDGLVNTGKKLKGSGKGFTKVLCYIDGELSTLAPANTVTGMKSRVRSYLSWGISSYLYRNNLTHLDIKMSRKLMNQWITDHCTFKEVILS